MTEVVLNAELVMYRLDELNKASERIETKLDDHIAKSNVRDIAQETRLAELEVTTGRKAQTQGGVVGGAVAGIVAGVVAIISYLRGGS